MEKEHDIFDEARRQQGTESQSLIINEASLITQEVDLKLIKKEIKNWKQLKHAIDNEHAEKFNRLLTELPDREFVRVYLKALEFFKPKVIRQAGKQPKTGDTTINIQINRGS